ncbi:MAG: NUDIX hydrolase [Pseudomonadales bacterium]|nr:NUDIX hydrolase [Pseudomonadales bacterium]
MTTEPRRPVPPRPSASLVIGREGAGGWEIFMARRHNDTAFAGGALVFPGGALEPQDEVGAADWLHAHRLAAIRETFEEVGILYARHADGAWPSAALIARLAAERAALMTGDTTFAELLARHGLQPALAELTPFAHWITPPERPKRFDTRFFLAALPPAQDGSHDGGELVDSFWAPPARVVALGARGECLVMRATEVNCRRLAAYSSCTEAIADFRAHPHSLVTPSYFTAAGIRYFSVPARAGRGVLTLSAKAALPTQS